MVGVWIAYSNNSSLFSEKKNIYTKVFNKIE